MNNSRIDLHTHTTASDGTYTPTKLVQLAKEEGLYAIAITDHDTFDGIEEAKNEGERIGVKVIVGVEIGVEFSPEMHILGYFNTDDYKKMEPFLYNLRKSRNERNPKMITKLQEFGYDISLEEVTKEAKGQIVGRPHFARVLVNKGYGKDIRDIFDRLLSYGKPGYVKKDKISPRDGIAEIIRCMGVPVLAHPILLKFDVNRLNILLREELVPAGLKGIEAYYVENSESDTGNTIRLALNYGLKLTGGSDFHGNARPNIRIGAGRGNLKIDKSLIDKLFENHGKHTIKNQQKNLPDYLVGRSL